MMGILHIEMDVLNLIGNWLDGSGWVDVFKKAFINTPGRVESFLKGTNMNRAGMPTNYHWHLCLS